MAVSTPTFSSSFSPRSSSSSSAPPPNDPRTEAIKHRLLRSGVFPAPKVLHAIRKKEAQKSLRRAKKQSAQPVVSPSTLSDSQKQLTEEEARFRTITREYRRLRDGETSVSGKPWELSRTGVDPRGFLKEGEGYSGGGKLKGEHLRDLREMFAERNERDLSWLLEDDVEKEAQVESAQVVRRRKQVSWGQSTGDRDRIRWLVHNLCSSDIGIKDWRFPRLMKQSGLHFAESCMLKLLGELEALRNWKHALSVVEWVYNEKEYRHCSSRFVYTKLLSILGKARRASEALNVFNKMREDCQIYPDMAAYHSIASTLGQAGFVRELINIIECMKQKPVKKLKNMRHHNWNPCLEPDVIIYNAVLNACVPTHQWKGVSWILQQMRFSGVKPTAATYGLAMEVMLEAGKYEYVHNLFGTMQRNGLALRALTYKVLVRAFWKEGKPDDAIRAVRDMENRGIVGAASLYYELACCLCNTGRWKEAMLEVEKLKKLPLTKPLEVAFTGMILSSMDGGHLRDCIYIFKNMKDHCSPNIGTINAMLKVYSRADMFAKAKELFEVTKAVETNYAISLAPDRYSYSLMLEASASAHQWEYFEHLYKEMALHGHQLDQNKHSWLLVEASKAGKWHILEHAFDTILERGEIPFTSLFGEMLCEAITQRNYERAILIINNVAHASLEVSEEQWTSLFKKNIDRIDEDRLQGLLYFLGDHDVVMEDPVPGLIRSLQTLCRLGKSVDKFSSHVIENVPVSIKSGVECINRNVEDTFIVSSPDETATDDFSTCAKEESVIPTRSMECHQDIKRSADMLPSAFSNKYFLCSRLDLTMSHNSDSSGSEDIFHDVIGQNEPSYRAPSALDILETWKQDRLKDGIFPF